MANVLMKFSNFCYHGNKGGSSKILNDCLIGRPKKTQFGAKFQDLS